MPSSSFKTPSGPPPADQNAHPPECVADCAFSSVGALLSNAIRAFENASDKTLYHNYALARKKIFQ
jgi:hypothetical protein